MYFGYKNISISYGKNKILENINIDFKKGAITTIIGANGCGKSSLLKVLTKCVKSESGYAYFNGKNILSYKPKTLAKSIAILPQIHKAPEDISVKTLISYGRYPHEKFNHIITNDDDTLIDNIVKDVGLQKLSEHKISTLSGGEQQRAWIGMAICQQPEILILDEPTSFLDMNYQIEILNLVKNLNLTKNLTVIMVLHNINLSARYSDYIVAIKEREIYKQGKTNDIINKTLFKDVFNLNVKKYYDDVNDCHFFISH